jgi:hypothetical protein
MVNPSRVTWLVLGTAMVLVSAVLVAAVVFINGSTQHFPRGGGAAGGSVVNVRGAEARSLEARKGIGGRRARLLRLASFARGQVAAHPAAAGVAALGPGIPGPPGGKPRGPTGHQYGDSLQLLEAKLGK